MIPSILLATVYYNNACFCLNCDIATRQYCDKHCEMDCGIESRKKLHILKNTALILSSIYEVGSLYKTRGQSNNIFYHYVQMHYYSIQEKIKTAIYMAHYKLPPVLVYSKTAFSWPTRNRVFSIMSKPASSIFLQNATSSLHMSTNSMPSFPRILWSSRLKKG